MTYTTLKEVPQKIKNLEPFESNSLRGEWMLWLDGGCRVYVVRSYSTPILAISSDGDCVINKTRYSRTTSRHQGLAQRALDDSDLGSALEVYDLPRGDLEGFLSHLV